MGLTEQIEINKDKYKSLFIKLDKEGRFNDRLPNDGVKRDEIKELADLERYTRSLEEEGSLSFMS
ncbi:MAG: hypothetical protein FWF81_11750 [Defluviitaleaceae bacterium]|nr:hypothetical protein [Defluviitaleaceae bacterium]